MKKYVSFDYYEVYRVHVDLDISVDYDKSKRNEYFITITLPEKKNNNMTSWFMPSSFAN